MRKYEGAFILLSNLEEDVRNAEIEKIKNIVINYNGTVDKVNEWGQEDLLMKSIKKETDTM